MTCYTVLFLAGVTLCARPTASFSPAMMLRLSPASAVHPAGIVHDSAYLPALQLWIKRNEGSAPSAGWPLLPERDTPTQPLRCRLACAGLRTRPRPQVALGGWLWGGTSEKPEQNDIFQVWYISLRYHVRTYCFWWPRDVGFRNAQGHILPCCFGQSRFVCLRDNPCRAPTENACCPPLTII